MKKYFRMPIVLVVVILLVVSGTAQASQHKQADNSDASGISSAYPLNRWKTDYIYTAGNAGSNVSMAFDPDHGDAAWVSYYADNGTWGSLEVAHFVGAGSPSANCGPSNTWHCEQVDASGQSGDYKGLYTSIDIYPDTDPDPGVSTWKVGVSYYDSTHKTLKYAQGACPPLQGCSWTIYTVDYPINAGDQVGLYTSMKFSPDGVPNIAYYAYYSGGWFGTAEVKRAFLADDPSVDFCQSPSMWRCDWVDQSIFSKGYHPSLDFDYNGTAYIAWNYYFAYNSQIYSGLERAWYAGIGDCGTGSTWSCDVIDHTDGENTGLFPSFYAPKNSNDVQRIAYYDSINGKLKYATSGYSSGGNCGPGNYWQCDSIDDMGIGLTWASISLAVDSNLTPMIAYTDAHEDLAPLALKVAEPAYLQSYANCGPGQLIYDWFCATLDSGNQYLDEAVFLSLGIKSNGMAMIAYSEENTYDYPTSYDLKFAYQTVFTFLPITMK
jgi:hypothetical protein